MGLLVVIGRVELMALVAQLRERRMLVVAGVGIAMHGSVASAGKGEGVLHMVTYSHMGTCPAERCCTTVLSAL